VRGIGDVSGKIHGPEPRCSQGIPDSTGKVLRPVQRDKGRRATVLSRSAHLPCGRRTRTARMRTRDAVLNGQAGQKIR
jgi:hypothetical protein